MIQAITPPHTLPPIVLEGWQNRVGYPILATVGRDGVPNAAYVASALVEKAGLVIIADRDFHKTRANVLAGGVAGFLFLDDETGSYQLKGPVRYADKGPELVRMQAFLGPQFPCHGVAILHTHEIYSGTRRLA